MNLIQQMSKKYITPTIEKIDLQTEDILTTSSESVITNKIQTIEEKYPNGLPLEVLKDIDWKVFGYLLGQRLLLPKGYLLEPIDEIIIEKTDNAHEVILKFENVRTMCYCTVFKIKKFKVELVEAESTDHFAYRNDLFSEAYRDLADAIIIGLELGSNFWMKPKGKGV